MIETMAKREPEATPASAVVDQKVVAELVAWAGAEGVSLTGEGGLLQQLTKLVLESSLEGEMDAHLGYGKHDPAGRNGGNSRNGRRSKTVVSEVGPVQVEVPRDRGGSFEPQIVRKRQRRLDGVDGIVLSLSAKGLTTGEISAHLAEVYGASVSKDTISAITDRVVDAMGEWQSRPLDPVYTAPSAEAAFDRCAEFSDKWERRYPAITRLWTDAWAEFVPFLAFDVEIRKVVCTTNAIESVNARLRRAVRARGHFPTEQAALKCLSVAFMGLAPAARGLGRYTNREKAALNAFDIA